MTSDHLYQLHNYGLALAGRYRAGAFEINPAWRPHQVVYAWSQGDDAKALLRVGIACGPKGFGRRYDHYNKWLAGRFKPDDPREQQVRRVFIERLGDGADVWAVEVADKGSALALESELRQLWGSRLCLDLMVRDSWGKQQMNAWRAGLREIPIDEDL